MCSVKCYVKERPGGRPNHSGPRYSPGPGVGSWPLLPVRFDLEANMLEGFEPTLMDDEGTLYEAGSGSMCASRRPGCDCRRSDLDLDQSCGVGCGAQPDNEGDKACCGIRWIREAP